MGTSYLNKWVVCKRYPNAQNNYIGKIQCLYINKETDNMVYGVEGDITSHWKYHYHKDEVVRVITEDEKHEILQAQMHTRNNYRNDLEGLQKTYSVAMDEIAKGTRKKPFRLLEDKPDEAMIVLRSYEQQRCPHDDALGILHKIQIVKDPMFNQSNGIKATWECQECHSQFETVMPYLEILKVEN